MIKKLYGPLKVLPILLFLFACDFTPGGVTPPSWELGIIGPIGVSRISLEDLTDFDSLAFDYKASANEINDNIPAGGGTLPFLPPFSIDSIPGDTFQITESFKYAIFDSGLIVFEFFNNLPITLNPGQIVNIYSVVGVNQDQRGPKIFDFTITQALGPGESERATLADFTGLVVSSNLILTVGNISSDGSTTPVTFDENSGIELKFAFTDLKVQEIGLASDNEFFNLGDTTPFDFVLEGGATPTELESGLLRLKFRNGIPLNIDLGLKLYDSEFGLIDDFIPQGQNIIAASDTSSILIVLNQDNINLFQSSSFLVSNLILSGQATQGDTVIINTDSLVSVKIIADLDLKVQP
jgi:hypothetical protein